MFSKTAVTLFASAALVVAHGIPSQVVVDGKPYPGTKNWDAPENKNSPVRRIPLDTGFVNYKNVNTMDIACSSAGYSGTPIVAPIKAGGTVDIRWSGDKGPSGDEWPHPEGPAISYLASCNGDCKTFDPRNAKFFKIQEDGLDTSKSAIQSWIDHEPWGKGLWIQNKAMLEGSWFHTKIPADIADGEYLLRHELISLHGAQSRDEGAQYYPACIQIKVTGGGSAKPAGIPATQLYTVDDGLVNIYEPYNTHGITSYKIPGPALYTAGKAADPATSPATTSPTSTKAASTAAPTSTKAAAAAVTSAAPTTTKAGNAAAAPSPTKAATSSSAAAYSAPSVKSCKAKRAAKRSAIEDETRELYDRALTRSRARRAHANDVKRSF